MAKHYIRTTITYWYESDNDQFANEAEAEAFGYNFDQMMYDGIDEIKVEEFENEEEEEEEND